MSRITGCGDVDRLEDRGNESCCEKSTAGLSRRMDAGVLVLNELRRMDAGVCDLDTFVRDSLKDPSAIFSRTTTHREECISLGNPLGSATSAA